VLRARELSDGVAGARRVGMKCALIYKKVRSFFFCILSSFCGFHPFVRFRSSSASIWALKIRPELVPKPAGLQNMQQKTTQTEAFHGKLALAAMNLVAIFEKYVIFQPVRDKSSQTTLQPVNRRCLS
jgi:hypothetical protein